MPWSVYAVNGLVWGCGITAATGSKPFLFIAVVSGALLAFGVVHENIQLKRARIARGD